MPKLETPKEIDNIIREYWYLWIQDIKRLDKFIQESDYRIWIDFILNRIDKTKILKHPRPEPEIDDPKIDNVECIFGDRTLIRSEQEPVSENGIWIVSSGDWSRPRQ